ncbi:hypothetical protein TraAM80_00171 [Trypanosoma rangeli]|uniref:Uncharacterized protein n=1 Tax=Trypanosoma rangeli TaxID=5698 RepID=A0A3R7N4F6_TRYRA|nr:uncharacterized protein TraAM80_00171 [Trypanosoma rangeli]RNF12628.1 hypothetical protein TraAM80_00171 [Trypanosoma rangeli]|eukprot:RNF12628.1 hypothetical protein TraAM80_00171 [Trypanosoma rangeli]
MENKAPGTTARPGGYDTAGGASTHENFFHPRRNLKKSVQRAGLRSSRRVAVCFTVGIVVFLVFPTYLGPLYVEHVASRDWLERANKSIWTRRNEKDYDLYMTQRRNGWLEYLGLKHYNIGGDKNLGEIQKYRQGKE